VTIDSSQVIPDEEPAPAPVHLISQLLADFFFNGDTQMAGVIDSFHTGDNDANQVFGFGVIAQALWMSKSFTDDGTADADLVGLILQAKSSGDYSQLSQYFDEGTDITNWGQLQKALRDNKEKHNLGVIISGHGDDSSQNTEHGKNNNHGKGKDKIKSHP